MTGLYSFISHQRRIKAPRQICILTVVGAVLMVAFMLLIFPSSYHPIQQQRLIRSSDSDNLLQRMISKIEKVEFHITHFENKLNMTEKLLQDIGKSSEFVSNNIESIKYSISTNDKQQKDSMALLNEILHKQANKKKIKNTENSKNSQKEGLGNIEMLPGHIRITRNMNCMDGYNPDRLIVYPCNRTQPKQYWVYTKDQQLQTSEGWCIDGTGVSNSGILRVNPCDSSAKRQKFTFIQLQYHWNITGLLQIAGTNQCLTAPSPFEEDIASVRLSPCKELLCRQAMYVNAIIEGTFTTIMEKERFRPIPKYGLHTFESTNGKGGRIFCWVMTSPANLYTKAIAVSDTWGRHCDKLVFVSTQTHPKLKVWLVNLAEPESRSSLWKKSKFAWMKAYHEYLNEFDWFIRCDDDSYLMMDNLRDFLSSKNPNDPYYIGRYFLGIHGNDKIPFYGGGAGTILSRQALNILGESATKNKSLLVDKNSFADDMELGLVMRAIGFPAKEWMDDEGRNLFIALGLDVERGMRKDVDPNNWFWLYSPSAKERMGCCSTRWIGTHYLKPQDMKTMEDLHFLGCEGAGVDGWK